MSFATNKLLACAISAAVLNRWLGGVVVVRASELYLTGCEFDSRPCTV